MIYHAWLNSIPYNISVDEAYFYTEQQARFWLDKYLESTCGLVGHLEEYPGYYGGYVSAML